MAQDLNKIATMYDQVAAAYAEHFAGEHQQKPKDQETLQRFAREIGETGPAWDLGCGPGHTATYLKNLGVEISGMDLSEKLLAQASARYPEVHFEKGNLLDLPLKDNAIAGAVSFYAMVHFTADQVEAAFREIYRVLTPGGLFLFTYHIGEETLHLDEFLGETIDIDFMFYTTAAISSCLAQCGFEKIETIEREPYREGEHQSRRAYVFATKP